MNKVIIAGRVVEKPVVRYNDATDPNHEHPFAYVKVAANDKYGETDFFTLGVVNKSALACNKMLNPGDIVSGEGAIKIKQSVKDGKVYTALFIKYGYLQYEYLKNKGSETGGEIDISDAAILAIPGEAVSADDADTDPIPF